MSYVFGVDREIVDRGFDYYLWGRVASCRPTFDETVFEAEVLGSKDNIYNVEVDLENLYDSICECKYYEREASPCKHIMAAFFEIMDDETNSFEDDDEEFEEDEDDDGFEIIDEDDDDEEDEENGEIYDINLFRMIENPISDDYIFEEEEITAYAEYADFAESADNAEHADYAKVAYEADFARVARVAEYAKYARHIVDDRDEDDLDEHEDDPEYERTKKLVNDCLGQLFDYNKKRANGDLPYDSRYEEEPGKCVNIEDFIRSNDYALDDEYDLEYPIDDFDESGRFVGKNKNKKYGIKDFVDSLDDDAVRDCLKDILEKLESIGFDIDIKD